MMKQGFPRYALRFCQIHAPLILLLFLMLDSGLSRQALSQPAFSQPGTEEVLIETDQRIALRDGIELSALVIRPAGDDVYPTLYAATPLPLTDAEKLPAELGPAHWYASQGYAVVAVNVRGTGASGGDYGFFSREEQQDHYEILDWISQHSWSDGRVAGYGSGYSGTAQWQMAAQFSRHLQCIAPHDSLTSPYRESIMNGGLRNPATISDWYERGIRDSNAYSTLQRMVSFDLLQATREHPLEDDFWLTRAPRQLFGQVNVPVFVVDTLEHLSDGYAPALFERLPTDWKHLLLPASEARFDDTGFHARELLPFYAQCLTRQDTSYAGHSRVRVQTTQDRQATLSSVTWPLENTQHVGWYLDRGGNREDNLGIEAPAFGNGEPLATSALLYRSLPLEQSLTLAGSVQLELHLTPRSQDTAFLARLYEESGTTRRLLSQGRLRASMRAMSPRSDRWTPDYLFNGRQLLLPGRRIELAIALNPVFEILQPGSQLVLELGLVDDDSLPPNGGQQIMYGGNTASRLWLPVYSAGDVNHREQPQI